MNDALRPPAGDDVLIGVAARIRGASAPATPSRAGAARSSRCCCPGVRGREALRRIGEASGARSAPSRSPSGAARLAVTVSVGAVRSRASRGARRAHRRGRPRALRGQAPRPQPGAAAPDSRGATVAEAARGAAPGRSLALAAGSREGVSELHAGEVAELVGARRRAARPPRRDRLARRLAGWLHDVGKVASPTRCSRSRARSTTTEWASCAPTRRSASEIVAAHRPALAEARGRPSATTTSAGTAAATPTALAGEATSRSRRASWPPSTPTTR